MELNNIHKVYFVGIGGIGMSALARYFVAKGLFVAGYDKTPSIVTDSLVELGVSITFDNNETAISKEIIEDRNALIIYTPAIPSSNNILKYFEDNYFAMLKRSEVLGLISKDTFCMAVAGTHGKTTTSALLGHIMKECNTGASAFIGGIVTNYNSNLILGDKDITVMEADEYDRSFMRLFPNIACVTSVDADHLDIYGDAGNLENTFKDFVKLLPENGKFICKKGLEHSFDTKDIITYSIDGDSDYIAKNIRVDNGKFIFDIINSKNEVSENVTSNLPGRYNIENTLAAFAMAEQYGINAIDTINAIQSFEGIFRRFNVFEYKGKTIIDDYAHHPSELEVALDATRELFIGKTIKLIFQPHLYSRTRDFENEFAEVLSKFDSIRLLDIYPARELPIDGVTSSVLLNKISKSDKKLISKEQISEEVDTSEHEIVMMLGAGDISVEIEKLRNYSV